MQEEIENMYVSDFILIGQYEEGRELTLKEWNHILEEKSLASASKKNIYFSVYKGISF